MKSPTGNQVRFPDGVEVIAFRWPDVLGGVIQCSQNCDFLHPPVPAAPEFACGRFHNPISPDGLVLPGCFETTRSIFFAPPEVPE